MRKIVLQIVALAGSVWFADAAVSLPLAYEGGLFALGLAAIGVLNTKVGRRALLGLARDSLSNAEQASERADASMPGVAPAMVAPAQEPFVLPSDAARRELLAAWEARAAARERMHVQPASVRRIER